MYWEQRKIGRKEARPKYTKVECVEIGSRDGTEEVSRAIKKSREVNTSKEMEKKLKTSYGKLSGKGVKTEDGELEEDMDDLD